MTGATKKILGLHEQLILPQFHFKHLNKALNCATFMYIDVHWTEVCSHVPKL